MSFQAISVNIAKKARHQCLLW